MAPFHAELLTPRNIASTAELEPSSCCDTTSAIATKITQPTTSSKLFFLKLFISLTYRIDVTVDVFELQMITNASDCKDELGSKSLF